MPNVETLQPQVTKRLIRKCKCGNTIAVEVRGECCLVYNSGPPHRSCVVWDHIEILNDSGYLRRRMWVSRTVRRYGYRVRRTVSKLKDLSYTNRNGYKAVFCNCGRINHLSKFVEPKEV